VLRLLSDLILRPGQQLQVYRSGYKIRIPVYPTIARTVSKTSARDGAGRRARQHDRHSFWGWKRLPCERKSVEPIAVVTAPSRVSAQHRTLLHFIGEGPWSDEKVLAKVREMVLPEMQRHGPIEAWIIDDTAFPKQGQHSVGVARQYCGQLGKQDNCQVAVTLSIANQQASLPVAYRLYLPQEWASDAARRSEQACRKSLNSRPSQRSRLSKSAGLVKRPSARDSADGSRLWQRCQIAHGAHGTRCELCGRHSVEHLGMEYPALNSSAANGLRNVGAGANLKCSQSKRLHFLFRERLGARSNGGKARLRHIPNSVATMRRRLLIALVRTLSRCPYCTVQMPKYRRRSTVMTQ